MFKDVRLAFLLSFVKVCGEENELRKMQRGSIDNKKAQLKLMVD